MELSPMYGKEIYCNVDYSANKTDCMDVIREHLVLTLERIEEH